MVLDFDKRLDAMIPVPPTTELQSVARRCVWFLTPDEAVTNAYHFAHVLTYGAHEDVTILRQYVDDDALREALAHAPAGIFDARSWSYCQLILNGRSPAPPLPTRDFTG